ncbi:hypothetical protein DT73_18690 [Mangrovibacter sp. MFB070]|uniref:hypothetical protein n=1 Tax=Mangrovibacter sp. MFB070 TaxID=1224318 RepID=UPI0004D7CBE0|nr:hypothetical protein [Mangrovibacter sp. MFB070]KEA51383.1 hypothetical protein DT73_18690 [Mangrovibacter sp. MFB070]
MNTKKRWLSFVLTSNDSFDELLIKIQQAFKCKLSSEDDEGRYIAKARLGGFSIKVIDRVDRLSELLCDENYTLEIEITSDEYFNYDFEKNIRKILNDNSILWERLVWAPDKLHD